VRLQVPLAPVEVQVVVRFSPQAEQFTDLPDEVQVPYVPSVQLFVPPHPAFASPHETVFVQGPNENLL
jgi:hypothetical protein